jgi:hypothetical protein
MTQDVSTVLKELLKSHQAISLRLLECVERLYALEATLVALDQGAVPLLEKFRTEAHDKNQTQRQGIEMWLAAIESLTPQKPS